MNTLVALEHRRGAVTAESLQAISAAKALGGQVIACIIGADAAALAAPLSKAGTDQIVAVRSAAAEFDSDTYRRALTHLIEVRKPEVVLTPFSTTAMSYAPAVAAELGLGFASDVFEVREKAGEVTAVRGFYGGKLNGELAFPGRESLLLMLRPGAWPDSEIAGGGSTEVEEITPSLESPRTSHSDYLDPVAGDVDITGASVLISVGRGLQDRDELPRLEALASRLGGMLSVSRPLVDAGWVAASRQVGQSGKTVTPRVYVALGISGAVQHLAGMRGASTIIAVNTDPEAAIFDVAHYGANCDLLDVLEELEQLL